VKLALVFLLANAAFAQTARIEGRVLTMEGDPVPKAQVRLQGQGQRGVAAKTYVEVAGRDGSFAIDVEPGSYYPEANATGYMVNSLGANRATAITVMSAETRSVDVRLVRMGVLSGTVVDYEGDPVPFAFLTLMTYGYDQGRMRLTQQNGVSSDDQGRFRFTQLQPGRYYIQAIVNIGFGPSSSNDVKSAKAQESNLSTYYPSSADVRGAKFVDVGGKAVENLEIRMRRGRLYAVRGTIDGALPEGRRGTGMYLMPKGGDGQPSNIPINPRSENQFEAPMVPPGAYTLHVRMYDPGDQTTGFWGQTDVTVTNADVNGVVLRMSPITEFSGHFRVDDGTAWEQFIAVPPTTRTAGNITRPIDGEGNANRPPYVNFVNLDNFNFATYRVKMEANGTFTVKGLEPGRYLVNVGGLPGSAYVKSIALDGKDVTGKLLELGAGVKLQIDVSSKSGALQPRWPTSSSSQTPLFVTVWPVEPDRSHPTGRVMTTMLNPNGSSFRFASLAPGDYYMAGFEDLTPALRTMVNIPDFLAKFNERATKVTVRPGENATGEPARITLEVAQKAYDEFP
jgi:hypothetical protein